MRTHLALVLVAACAAPSDDLLASVPQADSLVARLVGGDVAGAGGSEPLAVLYVATRRTSAQLNGMVRAALGTVWDIAQSPPTEASPGRAVWGPITSPLSPAVYRLVVERSEDGSVHYHVDGRPRSGGDFQTILAGAAGPGAGEFAVNFTIARALDPAGGFEQDGGMTVQYQVDAAGAVVRLALDADAHAAFEWTQRSDGSGAMNFGAVTEMGALALRSIWTPGGAGRADANGVTECWDALFHRVFLLAPGHIEGDPAACVAGSDG
jgi:hypothetical protein